MRQVVRVLIAVVLAAYLNLGSAVAQYAYQPSGENPFQLENLSLQTTTPITLTSGQKFTDVGRTLFFSGVALAVAGVVNDTYLGFMGYELEDREFEYGGGLPIATYLGAYAATIASVASIPFFILGHIKSKAEGSEPIVFDGDYRGFKTIIETGWGMPYLIHLDAVHGYYLTNNIFLGAGAGIDFWDGQVMAYDGMKPSFNLYGNARVALGKKRVTPYFSGSFGYNVLHRQAYTGLECGVRFRQLKRENAPLWIGVKAEYTLFDPNSYVLNCSWSF